MLSGTVFLYAGLLSGLLICLSGTRAFRSLSPRIFSWLQLACHASALGLLIQALLNNDFSLAYVVANSNTSLPTVFKVGAAWGGHQGSLLFWVLAQSAWIALYSQFSSHRTQIKSLSLRYMAAINLGLQLLLLLSNPFTRTEGTIPEDGTSLNPLLQDIGLIIHPPMLYLGYAGFVVVLAVALSCWKGEQTSLSSMVRPWLLGTWSFMTLGILIGSWWAYSELGWGGWWFWDPVENASLMPWLTATALMHALPLSYKSRGFQACAVLLSITTLALIYLGAFLVRSGVLTSVHAFTLKPELGAAILLFIMLVIGGALTLFALGGRPEQSKRPATLSTPSILLASCIIILLLASSIVLLGTLFPMIYELLSGTKISVGAPYFNTFFLPLTILLVLVFALYGFLSGNKARLMTGLIQASCSAVIALGLLEVTIGTSFRDWLLLTLSGWALIGIGRSFLKAKRNSTRFAAVIHTGLLVTVAGAFLSSSGELRQDLIMAPGQSAELGGYSIRFEGATPRMSPEYMSDYGFVSVFKGYTEVANINPEKRLYNSFGLVLTEAGVDSTLFRDIYITMGEPIPYGAWEISLKVKPFIGLLWAGALIMVLGSLLSACWSGLRKAKEQRQKSIHKLFNPLRSIA